LHRRQRLQPAPRVLIDIAEPGDERVSHPAPEARILAIEIPQYVARGPDRCPTFLACAKRARELARDSFVQLVGNDLSTL